MTFSLYSFVLPSCLYLHRFIFPQSFPKHTLQSGNNKDVWVVGKGTEDHYVTEKNIVNFLGKVNVYTGPVSQRDGICDQVPTHVLCSIRLRLVRGLWRRPWVPSQGEKKTLSPFGPPRRSFVGMTLDLSDCRCTSLHLDLFGRDYWNGRDPKRLRCRGDVNQ